MQKTSISIVVPVFRGEAYLQELTERVTSLRRSACEANAPYEVAQLIFVDDSAPDGSGTLIDAIASENPWVTALHLSRNYGQHAATVAGILHSSSEWVITMDEDLQHPPERIPYMLHEAVGKGADVVYAKAISDVHAGVARDIASRSFKLVMQGVTGNPNVSNFNSFRLIRGNIARAVASVCSHDTYFDVSLSWFTKRVETLKMELKDLRHIEKKESGYTLRSLLSHARRLLFSSQIRLLYFATLLGAVVVALSTIAGLSVLFLNFFWPELIEVRGWTSLVVLMSFFGGVSTFMLGIALHYISTLVLKAHGKPTFFLVDRSSDADILARLELVLRNDR